MRKILLTTTLLSIAMSENILQESYPKSTIWIHDKSFWNRKTKRLSRDDVPPEFEEFSNYDDDRQLPRMSNTRFIGGLVKSPSIAFIRQPDLTRLSQIGLLSPDKLKLENVRQPTVLISIGIQERTNARGDSQSQCLTKKNCRKYNQNWQLQQPLYVEEPRFVVIDSDYIVDPSGGHSENGDPYILTRGKKIFGIKNAGQLNKMMENEEFLDYSGRSEQTKRNRVRRSVEMEEESPNDVTDEKDDREEETSRRNSSRNADEDADNTAAIENQTHKSFNIDDKKPNDIFIKKYKKGERNWNLARISPQNRFEKRDQTLANGIRIKKFLEKDDKAELEDIPNSNDKSGNDKTIKTNERSNKNHFVIDANKGSERLAFKRMIVTRKKRGNRESDAYFKENDEKETIAALEQIKKNIYIDKLNDPFIPSRGKKPLDGETESRHGVDRDGGRGWKNLLTDKQHYAYRKDSKNENDENELDIDGDDAEITGVQLTDKRPNLKSSGMKDRSRYREKRNAYETKMLMLQQDRWSRKDIEKAVSPYLKPRDKHGKIVDLLNIPADPFFIVRGKKATREPEVDDPRSISSEPRYELGDDVDRAGVLNLPTQRDLLRMLLAEKSSCNDRSNVINANRFARCKEGPRDRRGSLDKILNLETLKYDPFYVVRGKRTGLDNFQGDGGQSGEQNQKSVSLDIVRSTI